MVIHITTAYALRALLFMARRFPEMTTAREIVSELNIPNKYVRRLITRLSKAGFIRSQQGRNGGYVFIKSPDQINVMDLMVAMNDIAVLQNCILGFENCSDTHPCALHTYWAEIRKQMQELFKVSTLSHLLQNQQVKI
ncbi:MAG: RrF2 family transcriptional regulator [Bacteroidales bacterium]